MYRVQIVRLAICVHHDTLKQYIKKRVNKYLILLIDSFYITSF